MLAPLDLQRLASAGWISESALVAILKGRLAEHILQTASGGAVSEPPAHSLQLSTASNLLKKWWQELIGPLATTLKCPAANIKSFLKGDPGFEIVTANSPYVVLNVEWLEQKCEQFTSVAKAKGIGAKLLLDSVNWAWLLETPEVSATKRQLAWQLLNSYAASDLQDPAGGQPQPSLPLAIAGEFLLSSWGSTAHQRTLPGGSAKSFLGGDFYLEIQPRGDADRAMNITLNLRVLVQHARALEVLQHQPYTVCIEATLHALAAAWPVDQSDAAMLKRRLALHLLHNHEHQRRLGFAPFSATFNFAGKLLALHWRSVRGTSDLPYHRLGELLAGEDLFLTRPHPAAQDQKVVELLTSRLFIPRAADAAAPSEYHDSVAEGVSSPPSPSGPDSGPPGMMLANFRPGTASGTVSGWFTEPGHNRAPHHQPASYPQQLPWLSKETQGPPSSHPPSSSAGNSSQLSSRVSLDDYHPMDQPSRQRPHHRSSHSMSSLQQLHTQQAYGPAVPGMYGPVATPVMAGGHVAMTPGWGVWAYNMQPVAAPWGAYGMQGGGAAWPTPDPRLATATAGHCIVSSPSQPEFGNMISHLWTCPELALTTETDPDTQQLCAVLLCVPGAVDPHDRMRGPGQYAAAPPAVVYRVELGRCSPGEMRECLQGLRPVLENPNAIKVVHDASGTCAPLHAMAVTPQPLFDTQVAHSLLRLVSRNASSGPGWPSQGVFPPALSPLPALFQHYGLAPPAMQRPHNRGPPHSSSTHEDASKPSVQHLLALGRTLRDGLGSHSFVAFLSRAYARYGTYLRLPPPGMTDRGGGLPHVEFRVSVDLAGQPSYVLHEEPSAGAGQRGQRGPGQPAGDGASRSTADMLADVWQQLLHRLQGGSTVGPRRAVLLLAPDATSRVALMQEIATKLQSASHGTVLLLDGAGNMLRGPRDSSGSSGGGGGSGYSRERGGGRRPQPDIVLVDGLPLGGGAGDISGVWEAAAGASCLVAAVQSPSLANLAAEGQQLLARLVQFAASQGSGGGSGSPPLSQPRMPGPVMVVEVVSHDTLRLHPDVMGSVAAIAAGRPPDAEVRWRDPGSSQLMARFETVESALSALGGGGWGSAAAGRQQEIRWMLNLLQLAVVDFAGCRDDT